MEKINMKFKSYIMPIVLLVFSLVMIFFLSIYHRTISSYNKNNSKEKLVINKFKNFKASNAFKFISFNKVSKLTSP